MCLFVKQKFLKIIYIYIYIYIYIALKFKWQGTIEMCYIVVHVPKNEFFLVIVIISVQ